MEHELLIRKSNRRAWCIVITGFVCFFFIYGSAYNCLGLFMKPMAETFGVPRTVISGLLSVAALFDFIFVPIVGKLVDKRDVKWLICIGCICMSLTYFIWASANSVKMLYVGAFIESLGIACTINMPIAIMVKNWFAQKQGLATGAAIVGSGLGGSILSQIVTRIIADYNWQTAYMILAVLILVTTVPLVIIFARKSPESIGLYKYGEFDMHTNNENKKGASNTSEDLMSANSSSQYDEYCKLPDFFKKPEFFLMFAGLFFMVLPLIGIKSHMVAFLTDIGYSPSSASGVLTLCLLAAIPGALLFGSFFDKLGTIKTLLLACACLSLGVLALSASALSIALAFFFSVVYGFATVIQAVGVPLIFTDFLRTDKNFATIMSISSLSMTIASAVGTLIIGGIFDLIGSYIPAFIGCALSFVLGFILIILAVRRAHAFYNSIS